MNKGYFYFQNIFLLLNLKIGSYWIANVSLTSSMVVTEKLIT